MTEQALLPAAPELETPDKAGTNRVLLFAAVAGVLTLMLAVYFVFFTGGSSNESLSSSFQAPRSTHSAPKATTKKAVTKPVAAAAVPATFTGVHSRDPFKPLFNPPPPAPVAPVAPVGGTSTGGTTQVVTLTSVGTSGVAVSINGVTFNPKVGDPFATYFKLVRLQGTSCATFLYGDESFDLCKGSTTTKQ